MRVRAFLTHSIPEWRWRIVDYHGQTIEESPQAFSTMTAAMDAGNDRLRVLRITPPAAGGP